MDETSCNKFLQSSLRKSVNIHGIPACKKCKRFDLLSRTVRIYAKKALDFIVFSDHSIPSTCRTAVGNRCIAASCKILRDLRNDHVGFVNTDRISDSQFQLSHDTDVVDTGSADCGTFKLHRIEDGHRIDKPCS